MNIDPFLWPMLIPMSLPIFYCIKYKKKSIGEVTGITLYMILIVIIYWPFTLSLLFTANIISKFLLFVFFPIILIFTLEKIRQIKLKSDKNLFNLKLFGIHRNGTKKSLKLGLIMLPLMLTTTLFVTYNINKEINPDLWIGILYFIESFTEEFFFKGILLLYLLTKTNIKVAYITSLSSFILMHPQNFQSLFILSTIIQGFLTIEICRRSKNLIGAWFLHGTNRFFNLVIIPFIF